MKLFRLAPALLLFPALLGGHQSQMTPKEILGRSLQAHGGNKLADWKSMIIKGTTDMSDGIVFRAAYLVYAKAPDRLRVEKDQTAARGGRYFYEYFLNGDAAWSRRNLIPDRGNLEEMKRWMRQCYGIAYFAGHADSLTRKEDAVVQWREKPDLQSTEFKVIASRPAYVIAAAIGSESFDLYIDKENYYFLQETTARYRRVSWDFKKFGAVVMPGKILEITGNAPREVLTPYTYDMVSLDVPVEDWLFTEDKPKK